MRNMNQMMKQVKKMQEQMLKAQEELGNKTVEGSAGGGVVKVTATGHKKITDIVISPEASIRTILKCCKTWCWPQSTMRSRKRKKWPAKISAN